jgi:3-carboxy-cis,cis-muconate cycloisomerase
MRAVFSDAAWIAAMLRTETALARAQAALGLAPEGLAKELEAIRSDDLDPGALGIGTALAGVPAIPFVKAVQERLPAEVEPYFHRAATSQDVMDTALALQMQQAFTALGPDLERTIDGIAEIAERHRLTPCIGRTYAQHAAPITFGWKAATWCLGFAEVADDLAAVRARAATASLGGPVGTLAALGEEGPEVVERFARHLGLAVPPASWHTRRARIAETGMWLVRLSGTLAKLATDVAHLASTEVGEIAEPHLPGRGGSSAMPHKRNPVSATVILAAHAAATGHLGTLTFAMAAAHERPAGAWHSEWLVLPQLFGLLSGALREAAFLAEGMVIDARRMEQNLQLTRGLIFADAVAASLASHLGRAAAHAAAERAVSLVRAGGAATLQEALQRDPAISPEKRGGLEAAFDIGPSVSAATLWTDRALEEVRAIRGRLREER